MKLKYNRYSFIKIFQISLLLLILSASIKSQNLDFDTIKALIQQYNDSSNILFKSVLKAGIIESLQGGLDLIKSDTKIYMGELKEKVDEVDNYLKSFKLSDTIEDQKIYLNLILDNSKTLWKSQVDIDKDELQQRLKEILNKAFEEVQKAQKGMGDVSYDQNFLKDIDVTLGDHTNKSTLEPSKPQPPSRRPPFPFLHVIVISVIVIIILLVLYYLIKRRKRYSANNLGYDRQVETY